MNVKAIWNDKVVAESNDTIQLEGNHYFPANSIKKEYFENSNLNSVCPFKGEASYHTLVVDGKKNEDAAWYYPHPKKEYEHIAGRIAFWKGVKIES